VIRIFRYPLSRIKLVYKTLGKIKDLKPMLERTINNPSKFTTKNIFKDRNDISLSGISIFNFEYLPKIKEKTPMIKIIIACVERYEYLEKLTQGTSFAFICMIDIIPIKI
jgi:hypothetical protein